VSELYRPSNRRLSAKLVPTFADRGVLHGQCGGSPTGSLTMDAGFVKITAEFPYPFLRTGSSRFKNIQFCCHLCCSSCVVFRNNLQWTKIYVFLSVLIFAHCFSSLILSRHDSCMQTQPENLSLALDTLNNVAGNFCHRCLQITTHQRSALFQYRTSLHFPILSHGLSLKHSHSRTDTSTT
jgi:hypothetical protein